MPKCATCEHFESCIMQKHITEMALILWNISREKEKEVVRGEWIPCKERLPKEYEVLCCDIYRNCIVGHLFADDSASTGFCAESEGEFMYECIAWMPLPKPYRERSK